MGPEDRSVAAEADVCTVGGLEGLRVARVSAGPDLERVWTWFYGKFEGLVPVDRSDWAAVENDVKRFAAKFRDELSPALQCGGG